MYLYLNKLIINWQIIRPPKKTTQNMIFHSMKPRFTAIRWGLADDYTEFNVQSHCAVSDIKFSFSNFWIIPNFFVKYSWKKVMFRYFYKQFFYYWWSFTVLSPSKNTFENDFTHLKLFPNKIIIILFTLTHYIIV